MKKNLLITLALALLLGGRLYAQNWDVIRTSGEYYWGVGTAATQEEATNLAMAELVGSIITHVSNDFTQLTDETNTNGSIDHKTQVQNCIKTYSQATLSNVEKWPVGKEPNITMRCYIKKSELYRIFESRIERAKYMEKRADEALKAKKIDMALRYYYWSYSLIRSVQFPNEVKEDDGTPMIDQLTSKIEGVLSDIKVAYDSEDEDDRVLLRFTYNGQPVSSLKFTYNDGNRSGVESMVCDGIGAMDMTEGYIGNTFHVLVDYEAKGQERGDDELESVLRVITRKVFKQANFAVERPKGNNKPNRINNALNENQSVASTTTNNSNSNASNNSVVNMSDLVSKESDRIDNEADYANIMTRVVTAIQQKKYRQIEDCFTIDGLEMYEKLIAYGTARIIGTPSVSFFKGMNGTVVARGLQMSFAFRTGQKKNYVENVVFTFNSDKKIDNVAFGLEKAATDDIKNRATRAEWKPELSELIMGFLETYKTAYSLKRIDYIRDVFADGARIIVGHVLKPSSRASYGGEIKNEIVSESVSYKRYTREEYLKHLERSFAQNEFIHIAFSQNEVQWLTKFEDKNKRICAIRIGQEYNSSRYADKGYLFLLVDMTDETQPTIYVRTWQPHEVDIDKLYGPGDFEGL